MSRHLTKALTSLVEAIRTGETESSDLKTLVRAIQTGETESPELKALIAKLQRLHQRLHGYESGSQRLTRIRETRIR
jgi:hypothetical protein